MVHMSSPGLVPGCLSPRWEASAAGLRPYPKWAGLWQGGPVSFLRVGTAHPWQGGATYHIPEPRRRGRSLTWPCSVEAGPMRQVYQALPGLLPSTCAGHQPPGSLSCAHTRHNWPLDSDKVLGKEASCLLLSAPDLSQHSSLIPQQVLDGLAWVGLCLGSTCCPAQLPLTGPAHRCFTALSHSRPQSVPDLSCRGSWGERSAPS